MLKLPVVTAVVVVIIVVISVAVMVVGVPVVVGLTSSAPLAERAAGVADEGEVGVDGPEVLARVTSDAPIVGLRPDVAVLGVASQTQLATVDDALERFRTAGLELPDLDVEFHDDQTACKGHDGLFVTRHTPWRVLVCSDLAFVLTHEFAHAWEAANLDAAARDRYVAGRGLSTWDSPEVRWRERGVEDAAFMLQQNLMAGRVDVESARWIERLAAYEALTGRRSPLLSAA